MFLFVVCYKISLKAVNSFPHSLCEYYYLLNTLEICIT